MRIKDFKKSGQTANLVFAVKIWNDTTDLLGGR